MIRWERSTERDSMRSDPVRWEPPAFLVIHRRGALVLVSSVIFGWLVVGGETAQCEATSSRWHCERHPDAPIVRMLGLGSATLAGPIASPRIRMVSSRGQPAAVVYSGSTEFRLPAHPSRERAEADGHAWLAWAREPSGTWSRTGPPRFLSALVVRTLAAVTLISIACSVWVHLRPDAPPGSPAQGPGRARKPRSGSP